ncbi:hypothetical protein [Candidatus Enterococcus clewellii]|uniref:Uncharacterized protein n=1 Tax=Candidatus Enterococcus clewellii TaxID=1834193 RepID=A0A242KD02_9ENTE|nr:hypothetical protein [Enterococcus sp. 9E7_DIV0242]OTP19032.1 hypothetical protein A5888_000846 [Enterococcus sp. 9E7_DIV0242]
MFQLKYPIFQKGRILKIAMLEALRDTPLSFIQTSFVGYNSGILQGFELLIENERIVVQPGILKVGKYILVLDEALAIPYFATDRLMFLNITVPENQESTDISLKEAAIELTSQEANRESSWELMRFKLKKGAYLRKEYQSFEDLVTEYNTVNTVYQCVARHKEYALSPTMIQLFCHYVQELNSQHPLDQSFCLQALQNNGVIGEKALMYYIQQRLKETTEKTTAEVVHHQLNRILLDIKRNRNQEVNQQRKNRKLIVD